MKAKPLSKRLKLRVMPDDGRLAWWDEYISDDPIIVKVTKVGYRLKYTIANTGERRTTDCLTFELKGSYVS